MRQLAFADKVVASPTLVRAGGVLAITMLLILGFQASAAAQANVQGQWQTLPTQSPINPVHIALMHNGQVLVVSGSGNLPSDKSYMAGVWNPQTDTFTTQPLNWDMFCNGMVVLPDGRPFVMSGTLHYDPFFGDLRTSAYNPATGAFVDLQPMAHGRWYPTATTLGDGRVMVFSGLDENGSTNTTVEIYTVGAGWSQPHQAPWTPPLYPRMHLLPNGNVFYSGSTTTSAIFNPATQVWTTGVAFTNYNGTRTYGSSVLLPLTPANGYDPRVMIMGGGSPATSTTEIIDLGASQPKWVYGPKMSAGRIEMDAVMLPTGNVLVLNGSVNDEDANSASLGADLYNTATNSFSSAGAGAFPRLYHSGALLLPDATVLVIGGNPQRGTYEPHMEIYSPAYLFNSDGSLATRPTITSVTPGVIGYGSSFQVQTPDATSITSAVLVRAGAATHAFDMDQRLVGLSFTAGNGVLTATTPPNGNIAPPGYYLLFILNSAGVPSLAQFVQLSLAPMDQPPTGTITNPTTNTSITPGQAVSFAGSGSSPTGSIASYSWVFPGGTPGTSTLANPGNVTFPNSGIFVASLTVTDSSGISDPNPPTRTISVLPDFSLIASPTLQTVAPGGQATYGVTVTPSTGFNGTVSFSVSGLPAGATGVFSPTSLSSSGISTLTISTTGSTPLGSSTLTITGTSGPLVHTAAVTLAVSNSVSGFNKTISVDFVGSDVPMGFSEVAGVMPKSNWNQASGASNSSPMTLVDETGTATTGTVTWASDNTWQQPIADEPGNARMMKGYLDNGNQDTSTVTVAGLPSDPTGYSVYVYAQGASNSTTTNTGIYQISGPGITTSNISLTYNSNFTGSFVQSTASNPIGNYVVFTIPNVSGFTLSAIPSTASSGYQRAPINGIQIVPLSPPNPNFTVTTTQSSATVGLASTVTYTVNVAAVNGFTGPVALSASGLPAGATASFSPASITTSGSSTMTVTTSSGTPTGSSTVTITGTNGSLTNSASVTLVVSGPDFTLSATPSSFSVIPGGSASYTVTIGPLYGFTDQVTLTAAGLPSGATATFSPASITQSGSSTLTVTTSTSTPGGPSAVTITGTGTEQLAHSVNVTLNVTAPDFSLAVTPASTSIISGGTATYTVTIAALNGFAGTVNLAAAGLPSGGSPSFSPTSISTSGSSTLTITTAAGTPTGSSTLAVTGTSGSLTHSANATLVVTSSSSTRVISVDFVGLGNPMGSTEVAGVVPRSNWNDAAGAINTSGLPLVDETGAATSAVVTWTADDVWDAPLTDQPGNVRLMEGYLDNGNQNTTIVNVNGLPPDPNGYNVYVYANGSITSGMNTGIYQISGTGFTASSVALTYTSNFNGTFTQATPSSSNGNYVVLTIPSTSAFTLSAIPSAASSGYKRAPINGIQIVPLGPPNPDFTISDAPASQNVNAGNSTTYTVMVSALNGFADTVNLTASGLPSGATPSFSPASISGSGTSTLTVTTAAGSSASSSTLAMTGTSGSLVHSATATLNVIAPDYSVTVSPGSTSVAPGGTATYTVTVAALNGFTDTVSLAATGLPVGATPSFSPTTITTAGTSTLTIITGATTGSSTITITGTSGSLTHAANAILNVTTAGSSSNVISVDFVGTDVPMAASEVAGVVAKSNWNNASGASSSIPMSLVDETGTSTNVTVSWTADDVWAQPIIDQAGNVRMMKGYLDNGYQDTTTVTVTGLPSDPNGFKVYVYVSGSINSGSDTGIYQVTGPGINSSSVTLTYKSYFSGTFTQATASSPVGNYLILTIPNVSGFTLSAIPSTATSGYERAPVNGIQIVPQ